MKLCGSKNSLTLTHRMQFKFAIINLIKLLEKEMKEGSVAFLFRGLFSLYIFRHRLVSLADENFKLIFEFLEFCI